MKNRGKGNGIPAEAGLTLDTSYTAGGDAHITRNRGVDPSVDVIITQQPLHYPRTRD